MITITPQGSYYHMKEVSLTERQTYNTNIKIDELPLSKTLHHHAVRLRVQGGGGRLAHSQTLQHLLHDARLEVRDRS
jgi:hypothetical protein